MENDQKELELKNAKRVYDTLIESLNEFENKFYQDDEDLSVYFGVRGDDLPIEIKVKIVSSINTILCTSLLPFTVPKDLVGEVCFAINALNAKLPVGNFEYDLGTGKIAFRVTSNYRDCIIGKGLFIMLIMIVENFVEEYNDKFFMLIMGKIGAEDFLFGDENNDDNDNDDDDDDSDDDEGDYGGDEEL